jgi:hypothetical protein
VSFLLSDKSEMDDTPPSSTSTAVSWPAAISPRNATSGSRTAWKLEKKLRVDEVSVG